MYETKERVSLADILKRLMSVGEGVTLEAGLQKLVVAAELPQRTFFAPRIRQKLAKPIEKSPKTLEVCQKYMSRDDSGLQAFASF